MKIALPLLSTTLLTLGLSISALANPLTATISKIIDGDTVTITTNGSNTILQLACIDSPDWVNGQAEYGAESSKNRLTQLLPNGSSIQYYPVGSVAGNRTLAVIFRGNSNINLQMVAEGRASLHSSYTNKCPGSANALLNAQTNAQNRRLGMWNR